MNAADRAQAYANAFYEAAFERWLTSLEGVARALQDNRALQAQLQALDVEFPVRQTALAGVAGSADPLVRNLLNTLLARGDLGLLDEVTEALRQRMRQTGAEPTPVEVTSAVALTGDERAALEARLQQQYGGNLAYTYAVDPAILGGMIVRVGDKLIDGSVASRLASMRQALGLASN